MKKETCILLSFGLGGHSEEYATQYSKTGKTYGRLSGYDNPDNWKAREETDYPDGTPVLDKREILSEKPSLAFASPMFRSDISEDDIERFAQPEKGSVGEMIANAVCLSSPVAKTSLALDKLHKQVNPTDPGPMDYISAKKFVQWWRDRGARVGKIENRKILWEGSVEFIFFRILKSLTRTDAEAIDLSKELIDLCAAIGAQEETNWYLGECDAFTLGDLIVGAYWALTEWHGGQSSPEYAALSALSQIFNPGMTDGPEPESSENEAYEAVYAYFEAKSRP